MPEVYVRSGNIDSGGGAATAGAGVVPRDF